MIKKLLKNKIQWQRWDFANNPNDYMTMNIPDPVSYPCIAIIDIVDTNNGWDYRVEFVYLSDFGIINNVG